MVKRAKPLIAAFIAALIANLFGVLLFFKPITEGDTSIVSIHPAIGLLIYVGLCISFFEWAVRQMHSVYKAAFMTAAPQFILIVDLTLRGERGLLTATAGTILLAATWIFIAYIYSLFDRSESEDRRKD